MRFWKEYLQKWNAILIVLYQGYMISTWITTGDLSLDHLVKVVFDTTYFLHFKFTIFFPFHTLFGRGIKLHLLEGRGSKDLWAYVKTTTEINKYLGEVLWGYTNILFFLKVSPANYSVHSWILPAVIITVAF